jgi:hypothetical protein
MLDKDSEATKAKGSRLSLSLSTSIQPLALSPGETETPSERAALDHTLYVLKEQWEISLSRDQVRRLERTPVAQWPRPVKAILADALESGVFGEE